MQDPTQLLPVPVLTILNSFSAFCSLLNHYIGYGWGYMAFVLISSLVALLPPISRWANLVKPKDGSAGITSDEAEKQTRLHFMVAFILCGAIDGYTYFHGGYEHYQRLSLAGFYAHGPGLVATITGVFMVAITVLDARGKRRHKQARAFSPGAQIQVVARRRERQPNR